ncbi:hypothetical protein FSP39_017641 [Pinctada imbricata]|uniref:CCHC-type domain-containing protein n=1 Tax=Pinctada imbricata TaxID=66713 RepID=A0AA88YJV2_PINIB|nr:hypothetical protein FSP39_017641 [Pinctada imbricata]
MATVEKSMDTDHADDRVLYDDGLTNEDAVSLFSTSLNKALERQKETIVSAISEKFTKDSAGTVSHVIEPVAFEFKHEGHKIQFSFNQERISKLSDIENFIRDGNFEKALSTLGEQKSALQQRNKILKIADRHGWDTVHEYLDDPLADNNEDAVKLRYAVGRAARERSFRTRPYDNRRRGGSFSANDFFRGFSNTFNSQNSTKPIYNQGRQFDPRFGVMAGFQFPRDRSCYYCRQTGHLMRDCPFTKAQPIPVLSSSTPASTNKQ